MYVKLWQMQTNLIHTQLGLHTSFKTAPLSAMWPHIDYEIDTDMHTPTLIVSGSRCHATVLINDSRA